MAEFSSYNLATININNITNATKIDALRTFIRTLELDIVFLQEVENEQLSLPGFTVVCNVDHNRRGTAIALKEHIRFTHVEKSLDGRLVALRIQDTTLCNVYAPSGTVARAERERFFNGTIAYYLRHNTQHVILAGDFNCVLRQRDSTSANTSPALQATVQQLQLQDVWLKLHPNTDAPTYIVHNAASRLDRMYVSTGLCDRLRTAVTHACSFTDHKALTARICLPHLGREQGRGFWSLRPHLLTAENIEEFEIRWQYWTRQRRNFPSWLSWWMSYAKPKIKSFFRWKSREVFNIFNTEHQRLYAQLRLAYDNYYQNPAMLVTINRVKAQMLTLQRQFTQNFIRINETFVAGESLSTFQLGDRRRKKTSITELQNERGDQLRDALEIEQHMFRYFQSLYARGETRRDAEEGFETERAVPAQDEANIALMEEITVDELKNAIRTSQKRKSPGSDGLPVELYQRTFDVIYRELYCVMNEAMTNELPPEFADGTIVLIKKSGGDKSAKGYRPISLLNVDYKILSRVMKCRLERVLQTHRVLSEAQKCSNTGRSIFQATLSLKDRVAQLIARKQKAKLISFDMDHAFDRVSHEFLHQTLLSLGVNPAFVGWLSRVANVSSSRLLINGRLSQPFRIERSVRQGDPMSMLLFVVYLHPLLTRLERTCGGDLCVAYADDITIIATSTNTIRRIFSLFASYELLSGAKLNRQKTVAVDVGFIDGEPLMVPDVQTTDKVKVLGVIFTNSVRLMVKLNWDSLVSRIAQIIWMHSMRSLTLQQKVVLLNTFITAKVWYLSSIIPPQCVHTAKLAATMGTFLFRGLPARIPMQQLVRSRENGGLKLHLPSIKCRALLVNRHLSEMDSLPYYHSILAQNTPVPAEFPCLKLLSQQIPLLPDNIKQNPTSAQIHLFYLMQTEPPRVERNEPGRNWKRIWRNISTKKLTSKQRSDLYLLINEKTEHRRLMNIIGRNNDPNCQHCLRSIETLQHKFCECPRVAPAWSLVQRTVTTILGGWQRPTFDDLFRPTLVNIRETNRLRILKIFINYINFVNESVNNRIDVNEVEFILNLDN